MSLLTCNKPCSAEFSKNLKSEKIQKRFESEMVQNCTLFSDPSIAVANFEGIIYDISKEYLRPKPAIIVEKVNSKQCDKWMNNDCFKA